MDAVVKEEIMEAGAVPPPRPPRQKALPPPGAVDVIDLSSSDSDSDSDSDDLGKRERDSDRGGPLKKRPKAEASVLPIGFLDPLTPLDLSIFPPLPPLSPLPAPVIPESTAVERPSSSAAAAVASASSVSIKGWKQFWKAGDFEGFVPADLVPLSVGMDHVRVHPKFLHSNATSHKWALGALAELLDNSLDEVCNGATYVKINMQLNKKDRSRMLLIEDNGGGMDPDMMRHCMSLGYSMKSKMANTIGQYGNGFKTSTMRLGGDVLVFSRSRGKEGKSDTQSIGMLSYTFLRNTGKEDIVVPMLDYEKMGGVWSKMTRSSSLDWNANLETIIQWSPYSSEPNLLQQFNSMTDQGTRIVIYNLWEDDQGELELDFDADEHDIQVRGVNRDEKKIQMARQFPNSRHFLTYRHSLRSYASILYLRLPHTFRIILRGKEVEHHNLITDMMLKQEVTYRPQPGADGVPKDPNMVATVTIGFVKDAKEHIDIQGFNVYHKNRLIKPFWRVWNAAGSDGRGVIGLLEANFVEPAHDKQGFERTTVLSRLEARLVQMQKTYWSTNCHKIGYAPRRTKKTIDSEDRESSPESSNPLSRRPKNGASPRNVSVRYTDKSYPGSTHMMGKANASPFESAKHDLSSRENRSKNATVFGKTQTLRSTSAKPDVRLDSSDDSDPDVEYTPSRKIVNKSGGSKVSLAQKSFRKESAHTVLPTSSCSVNSGNGENEASNGGGVDRISARSHSTVHTATHNGNGSTHVDSELTIKQLKDENDALKKRLIKMEESVSHELQQEMDKNKLLVEQLEEAQKKLEEANKEQEALIDIFSEERGRRDREEETLRKKLKDASATIQDLLDKLSSSRNLLRVDQ